MSGATRYILRQLLGPLAVLTLSLTGMIWLTQSLRFVDLIVNKGASVETFLLLSLLVLPRVLVVVLPAAVFCTVLYTYHRLYVESELVVLRAAGLSQWALARPAIIMATAVSVLLYALTIYFAPAGKRELMSLRFALRNDFALVLLQEGVFSTVAPGITVFVRERRSGGELLGILAYDERDPDSPVTMMAERGALIRSDEGPRFVLVTGNRQQVDTEHGGLSLLYFDKYVLDLRPFTKPGARWREPDERFLNELLRPGVTPDDINHAWDLRSEAHRRLSVPLYALAFALIALTTILSGDFNRRGRWRRMVVACGAAVALQAIALGLNPVVGNAPLLTPLLYATPLAAIAFSVYLLAARPRRNVAAQGLAAEAG
ncbi:MAG: LPS export ABC transporter permease LptF [Alphaproteobacteria bacterium]